MRYDPGHKARIRTRLLEEAAKAIRTEGPDRLGVADVMRRAGLTHGGFYAHFSSKDELMSEALGLIADARRGVLVEAIASTPPRDALRDIVSSYLSMDHRNAPATGCPLPILVGGHERLPKEAAENLSSVAADLTTTIAKLLIETGEPDPLGAACSTVSEMVGALALARLCSDERAMDLLQSATRSITTRLHIGNH